MSGRCGPSMMPQPAPTPWKPNSHSSLGKGGTAPVDAQTAVQPWVCTNSKKGSAECLQARPSTALSSASTDSTRPSTPCASDMFGSLLSSANESQQHSTNYSDRAQPAAQRQLQRSRHQLKGEMATVHGSEDKARDAGAGAVDEIFGEKPTSRGSTPFKQKAASTVSFALSKKLQQAFNTVDGDKTKFIEISRFTDFLAEASVKCYADEIQEIHAQVQYEIGMGRRPNGTKLAFDDVLELLAMPNYTLCINLEEVVSKERRDNIKKYTKVVLGSDDEARARSIAEPPTQLLGDKQAVCRLAMEMHNTEHPEMVRVYLARALGAVAEKPREVSGNQPPEGEKRNMMFDGKAIAACLFSLKLGEDYFLDKRSFYNPEPRGSDDSAAPPVGVGLMQAAIDWHTRAEEIRRPLEFHDAIPSDYCSRPEFYLPFKRVVHEHSDAVRVECLETITKLCNHENETIVKVLLKSAAHDPSWAVRATAVEKLGDVARELRKLGYKSRWGEVRYWWAEEEAPWRASREEFRAFFWSVLQGATRDLAWQVP